MVWIGQVRPVEACSGRAVMEVTVGQCKSRREKAVEDGRGSASRGWVRQGEEWPVKAVKAGRGSARNVTARFVGQW